jgi:hypothetical protein
MTAMLLKHSHDEEDEFLKLSSFWAEKLNRLDADEQMAFIKTVFYYIESALNLTQNKLSPIFTQVSENINNVAMTIADEIREENTFNHVRALIQEGIDANLIAKAFKIPLKKMEEIIEKIKASSN